MIDIIENPQKGRNNDQQRIIAYNVGIALHDVYFAYEIYKMLESDSFEIDFAKLNEKFRL